MHTKPNASFIGKVLTRLDFVDSTNDHARFLLSKSKPQEGTAIIAQFQEKGKGQFGNKWESEAGSNLLMSIILYPDFLNPADLFYLNKAISLAVKDLAEVYLERNVFIKWPNDIYCGSQKLAGILIETSVAGGKISEAVIGIGLNVNQTEFGNEIKNPTSFKTILQKEMNLKEMEDRIFSCLDIRYDQLKQGLIAVIERDYNQSLYGLNLEKNYRTGHGPIKARITGVNELGQLVLESEGRLVCFNHKEIEEI